MTTTTTPTKTSRRGTSLGTVVFGGLLIIVGVAWLLDRLNIYELQGGLVLPGLLTVIGAALIVGAWDGEHTGLVVLGVFTAIATVFAAVLPSGSFTSGVGDRVYAPASIAELEAEYDLGVGQLRLDLTRIPDLGRRSIDLRLAAGEAVIVVPAGLGLDINAHVGAGEVVLFGDSWSGLDVERTFMTAGYASAPNAVAIDIEILAGKAEVTR